MARTVLLRADDGEPPAPSGWRDEFAADPLFVRNRPDTETVDVIYDPGVKERYEAKQSLKREVRKLKKRPDVMQKFGAHAGDETRQRREQERLEALALEERAQRDAQKHREQEIAARLLRAEEHWQELSTGGQRKNPHLAARLIFTRLLLAANYDNGFRSTGTVPESLRTPAAIATATGLSKRTAEQELAVLHDAGWVKVAGIESVPGRRTYGGEITLPAVATPPLAKSGSVVRLLDRMDTVTWRMGSLAEKVLYLFFCTRPQTSWNHREDQRFSPMVDRAAVAPEAINTATGLHRNSSREAKKELIASGLLANLGHDLVIADPMEVQAPRPQRQARAV